jgi:hypothetical protein
VATEKLKRAILRRILSGLGAIHVFVAVVWRRILSALGVVLAVVAAFWRGLKWLIKSTTQFVFGVLLLFFFIPFLIGIFVLSTPKDVAYRNFHVALPLCKQGLDDGWTILAEVDQKKKDKARSAGDWVDSSNDELFAVAKDSIWEKRLRCSLQRHIIPIVGEAAPAVKKPIEYYLGFLEYQENGDPYSLVQDGANGDKPISTDFLEKIIPAKNAKPTIDQLDVLRRHLATGSNYVIAFVHGWRHDASIGDQNVADLRHYAAHAARFLAERCEREKIYCDTRVTAIYIGWRGARVNENAMRIRFGVIGEYLGEFAAGATLFDRKPVSEQVAPGAVSALRTLESVLSARDSDGSLKPNAPVNKMIIFGHSLGGNLLMTGLKDDLIKLVHRHNPREHLPSVLGDLVVLINPASEASKWTAVQREVWKQIAFHTDENTSIDVVVDGHQFFPIEQKPVFISVTSALAFPAGGLRAGDCQWIDLNIDDMYKPMRDEIKHALSKNEGMFEEGIEYDWATHDLFPTFKYDFRPLAHWFDRKSAKIEQGPPPGQSCLRYTPAWYRRVLSLPTRALAGFFRTFPFQNTDQELSHTIGNLDPPRPARGVLAEYLTSAAPFGTTHELMGALKKGDELHHDYYRIPNDPIECPPANNWLRRAREHPSHQHGTFWDSKMLATPFNPTTEGPPAAQFRHGFDLGGTAAITRANDPFWNIRAFDNALSKHDGFRLSSFICAMHQFVMDDITASSHTMPNVEKPPQPPSTAAPN